MNEKRDKWRYAKAAIAILVIGVIVWLIFAHAENNPPIESRIGTFMEAILSSAGEAGTTQTFFFPGVLEDRQISTETITKQSPYIPTENTCLSLGDFDGNPEWSYSEDGKDVFYHGKGVNLRVTFFCGKASGLLGDLRNTYKDINSGCQAMLEKTDAHSCIILLRSGYR